MLRRAKKWVLPIIMAIMTLSFGIMSFAAEVVTPPREADQILTGITVWDYSTTKADIAETIKDAKVSKYTLYSNANGVSATLPNSSSNSNILMPSPTVVNGEAKNNLIYWTPGTGNKNETLELFVDAVFKYKDGNNKTVTASSSNFRVATNNPDVATAVKESEIKKDGDKNKIIVTAKGNGNAVITITDNNVAGKRTAKVNITVRTLMEKDSIIVPSENITLGLGGKLNIGAYVDASSAASNKKLKYTAINHEFYFEDREGNNGGTYTYAELQALYDNEDIGYKSYNADTKRYSVTEAVEGILTVNVRTGVVTKLYGTNINARTTVLTQRNGSLTANSKLKGIATVMIESQDMTYYYASAYRPNTQMYTYKKVTSGASLAKVNVEVQGDAKYGEDNAIWNINLVNAPRQVTTNNNNGKLTTLYMKTNSKASAAKPHQYQLEVEAYRIAKDGNRDIQGGKFPDTGRITFTTSNAKVATVNPTTGMITAVGKGTAKITAVPANGTKVKKGQIKVGDTWHNNVLTVNVTTDAENFTVATNAIIDGKAGIAIRRPANRSSVNYTVKPVVDRIVNGEGSRKYFSYSIEEETMAPVAVPNPARGTIVASKVGKATLVVNLLSNDKRDTIVTRRIPIEVTDATNAVAFVTEDEDNPYEFGRIAALPTLYLNSNDEDNAKAKVSAVAGFTSGSGSSKVFATTGTGKKYDTGVTYQSRNPRVATIDSDGNIVAVGKGSTTIVATSVDGSRKSASKKVTVVALSTDITLSGTGVRKLATAPHYADADNFQIPKYGGTETTLDTYKDWPIYRVSVKEGTTTRITAASAPTTATRRGVALPVNTYLHDKYFDATTVATTAANNKFKININRNSIKVPRDYFDKYTTANEAKKGSITFVVPFETTDQTTYGEYANKNAKALLYVTVYDDEKYATNTKKYSSEDLKLAYEIIDGTVMLRGGTLDLAGVNWLAESIDDVNIQVSAFDKAATDTTRKKSSAVAVSKTTLRASRLGTAYVDITPTRAMINADNSLANVKYTAKIDVVESQADYEKAINDRVKAAVGAQNYVYAGVKPTFDARNSRINVSILNGTADVGDVLDTFFTEMQYRVLDANVNELTIDDVTVKYSFTNDAKLKIEITGIGETVTLTEGSEDLPTKDAVYADAVRKLKDFFSAEKHDLAHANLWTPNITIGRNLNYEVVTAPVAGKSAVKEDYVYNKAYTAPFTATAAVLNSYVDGKVNDVVVAVEKENVVATSGIGDISFNTANSTVTVEVNDRTKVVAASNDSSNGALVVDENSGAWAIYYKLFQALKDQDYLAGEVKIRLVDFPGKQNIDEPVMTITRNVADGKVVSFTVDPGEAEGNTVDDETITIADFSDEPKLRELLGKILTKVKEEYKDNVFVKDYLDPVTLSLVADARMSVTVSDAACGISKTYYVVGEDNGGTSATAFDNVINQRVKAINDGKDEGETYAKLDEVIGTIAFNKDSKRVTMPIVGNSDMSMVGLRESGFGITDMVVDILQEAKKQNAESATVNVLDSAITFDIIDGTAIAYQNVNDKLAAAVMGDGKPLYLRDFVGEKVNIDIQFAKTTLNLNYGIDFVLDVAALDEAINEAISESITTLVTDSEWFAEEGTAYTADSNSQGGAMIVTTKETAYEREISTIVGSGTGITGILNALTNPSVDDFNGSVAWKNAVLSTNNGSRTITKASVNETIMWDLLKLADIPMSQQIVSGNELVTLNATVGDLDGKEFKVTVNYTMSFKVKDAAGEEVTETKDYTFNYTVKFATPAPEEDDATVGTESITTLEAEPTASPETTPTADPEASPEATPTADPEASPEATPTADPEASPEATPTADPEASPEATPTAELEASPEVTPTAEPKAEASASPAVSSVPEPEVTPSVTPETTP